MTLDFDFDARSRYLVCSCGGKELFNHPGAYYLRVYEDRLKEKNNGGGILVACCSTCGEQTDMTEILAELAKWVNKQVPPTTPTKPPVGTMRMTG